MSDAANIANLIVLASNPNTLVHAQHLAAQKILAFDGEIYPHDGCAITLSTLLEQSDIALDDTFQALALVDVLIKRGWQKIPLGSQRPGDVGTTVYGGVAHHGADHVFLVLKVMGDDEMVIADNQAPTAHFRYVSGKGGKTPTRFFLRAE